MFCFIQSSTEEKKVHWKPKIKAERKCVIISSFCILFAIKMNILFFTFGVYANNVSSLKLSCFWETSIRFMIIMVSCQIKLCVLLKLLGWWVPLLVIFVLLLIFRY